MKRTTQLQGITDLTVLARVRTGFVPGAFNTITYANRLRTVLRVLNGIRQASREAALQRSPFTDSIGRFRAIHFFRFAIVPSDENSPGPHQLLLNVTFDGGWEPYMRIIWDPLGHLLDLIFCNCEGYPMAFHCSFDEYMRWVRENEVSSSFFYADSAATVADSHYLRELEELLCTRGGREGTDVRATSLALAQPPARTIANQYAVTSSVRVLKALATLRDHFPARPSDTLAGRPYAQDLVLLRFARDLLSDLREWTTQGLFSPGGQFDKLREGFKHERDWLMSPVGQPPEVDDPFFFNEVDVQAGIVKPYPRDVRRGLLVMLRMKDPDKARAWLLNKAFITPEDESVPPGGIYRNLAITLSGLRRLEVHEEYLAALPHEFMSGMEARAGVLGDLRGNHPENWQRPRRNWPWPATANPAAGRPIELSTVHLLMQLRTALEPGEDKIAGDGTTPLPRLDAEVKKLDDEKVTGLEVLFVQPMRLADLGKGEKVGRDHFGYVDGISQPTLSPTVPPSSFWSDQVKEGDLFLGYSNSRGDRPVTAPDAGGKPQTHPLLHNGTFLVMRKLRQFAHIFDAMIAEAAKRTLPDASDAAQGLLAEEIKAKIMGRYPGGKPVIQPGGRNDNDFVYRDDGAGGQCPHRSHIRRANPREPLPAPPAPRIVRRGMSYGPPRNDEHDERERGIIFMAYNASIAEQFEVIQRWLTGGNSSGLSSTQDDVLLGVPEIGQGRAFFYVRDGKVLRVDLGEKPLVQLEWGLYAFVPSLETLKALAEGALQTRRPPAAREEPPPAAEELTPEQKDELASREKWRLWLEDEDVRAQTWAQVRGHEHEDDRSLDGALFAKGYGLLAGSKDKVLEVLRDNGATFSAEGYGKCMDPTIGRGFLGMDDVDPHRGHAEQAPAVNKIIESIREEAAFDAAFGYGQAYLRKLLADNKRATGVARGPVDVIEFGRWVLAQLCGQWFGLPDKEGKLMKHGTKADDLAPNAVARCPGFFLTVSRYIFFSPYPAPAVEGAAKLHGPAILDAVKALLASAGPSGEGLTPMVRDIVNAEGIKGRGDLPARTVAGVMLGFPPTVLGNLVTVLMRWSETLELWNLQHNMPARVDYVGAGKVLREPLFETMKRKPVPYSVWRTAASDQALGDPAARKDHKVVVGLGSAMDDGGNPMLMFGGARADGPLKTLHACPGYEMAMGVMLGCVAALLAAGALAATADPRVLVLTGDK